MRYLFKVVFTSFLLIAPFLLIAQYNVDSLRMLGRTLPDGEDRLNAYKDLAFVYYAQDAELARKYCDTIEMIADRADLPKLKSKAAYFRAAIAMVEGDNMSAINHAQSGITTLNTYLSAGDTFNLINFYNIIGICQKNLGMFSESVNTYGLAGELALATGDSVGYGITLTNIGSAQKELLDHESARNNTLRSIEFLKTSDEGQYYLASAYCNLGTNYNHPDSALFYFDLAEEAALSVNDSASLAVINHNRSKPLVEKGLFRAALSADRKALKYAELYGDAENYTVSHLGIGQTYDTLGLKDSAIYFIRESINIGKALSLENHFREAYRHIAALFFETNQIDSAYRYTRLGFALQDSIYRQEVTDAVAASSARLSLSEKNRQITEQQLEIAQAKNARNRLLFGGLGALILLAGIFQYFLQRNRLRRKELALEVDKREAEAAQLRELDGLKTRFFTNISHELRTPLTLITSPLEEAIGRLKQVNLKPDLVLAHRNSQNLLTLVNEILDLSKLEAGQLSKQVATFAPEALLRRIFFAFASLAELRQVKLHFDGDFPASERLTADVDKLEKILNNLISNALKFSPEGGTITLAASRVGERLEVAVRDEGPGIPPAEQDQVFQRYYQSSRNAEHQAGTGIGLNLARKLARYLGGDLCLESTLGAGSTFTLSLPVEVGAQTDAALSSHTLAPASAPENAPEATAEPGWQPTSGRSRLLVVEDNPEMNDYLRRQLSPNYEVTTVANGRAALAALSKQDFDLISSDVMMPEMDGFELRRRINEKAEWRRIPFLLLTARNLEEDVLAGFRLGVDDYVTKPFSLPEYKARINNLLRNRDAREQVLQESPGESESSADDLVARAEALVRKRLADTTFTVEEMARELGHGQRQLSRLLGAATGLTPVRFILELRLQKARELLESRAYATVAEVRYEIGIESASYFTRKFTERFGKNPKALLER